MQTLDDDLSPGARAGQDTQGRQVASEKCPVSGTDRSEDGEGKDLKSTAPPQYTRGPRITY